MKALRSEIKLLQSLQHPRIVQYFGSEEKDGVLSIFMEYMPGVGVVHFETHSDESGISIIANGSFGLIIFMGNIT